jgi:hypothetical protein
VPTGGNSAVVEGGVAVVGLEGGVAVSVGTLAPGAGVSVVVVEFGGITPASASVCVTSGGGGGVATSNGTVVTGGGKGDGGGGKAVMGGGGVATGNGTAAGGGAGGMSGGAAVIGGTAGCADGTVVGAICPSATGDPMRLRQMTDETARATPPTP